MSYYVRIDPMRRRGMRFGRTEIIQIFVAVVVLTIAFTLALAGGIQGIAFLLEVGGVLIFLIWLGVAFAAVVTAFLLHELAHKALAQRYGCFAEFRYYPMGLALGVITAAFGFIFAAPGAVMISGPVTPRQHVRISAAGPGMNLVVAAGFLGLAVLVGTPGGLIGDLVAFTVGVVAFVNLFLGGFNLIPFPPLDGSKILAYDKVLWVGMIAVLVALGVVTWQIGLL